MDKEVKLKSGKTVKSGDIIFISTTPNNPEVLARARFVDLTIDGNLKLYVIDTNFKLVDIEISQERIVKIEKSN